MKEYLKNLPKEIKDLIYLAGEIAAKNDMPAYLVGGFVRDLLLGVKNLDLDIVVEGEAIKFAEDFAARLKAGIVRHKRFGTATLTLGYHPEQNRKIDITTARKEIYPQSASLPVVTAGTLQDDLYRRDFTINAMAISITGSNFGKLVDFFAGRKDLKAQKIRVLHDLSFIDDPTRMLRAIRFEKRYNFRIQPRALELLQQAVKNKMLEKVQAHRLRDEIILILKEECPLKSVRRIKELIGFNFIHKNLAVSQQVYQLFNSIQAQINWFQVNFPHRRKLDTWLIYLMGLVDPLNINDLRAVCKKFAFRRGEEVRLLSHKQAVVKISRALGAKFIPASRIFALLEPLSYEVIIMLRVKSKNRLLRERIRKFFAVYNGMRIHSRGDDLRKLGVIPGPRYQKIFRKVLNARLDGVVQTKEEELALIKKLISN